MQLSKTTEYAVRSLIFMKLHPGIQRLEDIANEMDIPEGYLVKVLRNLKNNKVVETCQGSKGGYKLSCRAKHLTLFKIMTYTEKTVKINSCLETGKCALTGSKSVCRAGAHQIYCELQEIIEEKLKSVTLDDLIENLKDQDGIEDYEAAELEASAV